MTQSTFKIDDPMTESVQEICGDFIVNFSREQKEVAEKEINKLSDELGYEIGLEPLV